MTTEQRKSIQSPRFLKYYDANDILLLFDAKNAIFGICSLKSKANEKRMAEQS